MGPGIFLFCWKPLGFFEVKIFASIRSSLSLELRSITSPPPPLPPLPRALSLFSRSPYILKASRSLVLFNLRSGVIFFFGFFASLAREGKNTDYRDKGRGHDRRLSFIQKAVS